MISYRHHIATLVAVFLALAVGIVLGGGPLSEVGRDGTPAAATTREQRAAVRTADFGDKFATATAQSLYAGRLEDHPVAIVTMPGADGAAATALADEVTAAGGGVTGTYAVREAVTSPSQKSLVDTLGSQLMTQVGGGAVDSDASTYVRLGELLALAVAPGDLDTGHVAAIRQSLSGGELLDSPKAAPSAQAVLVVLGDHVDPAILSGLTTGIATKVAGRVVVAGPTASGAAGGDLVALRADPAAESVTTVDGSDTPLGRVTSILALIRSFTDPGGSYGASGSDGAVPLT